MPLEHSSMLYLEDTPLFTSVPSLQTLTDGDVLRACGRIAAEAKDSEVSIDGTPAFTRCHAFGTLLEAVAVLVSVGAQVQIDIDARDVPGVHLDAADSHRLRACVAGGWDLNRLVQRDGAAPTVPTLAGHIVVHGASATCPCFAIDVAGLPGWSTPLDGFVASTKDGWQWVVREPTVAVRVCKTWSQARGEEKRCDISLYCSEILWRTERLACVDEGLFGMHFCIDVAVALSRPVSPGSIEWIPSFPDAIDLKGATEFGAFILHTRWAHDLSNSQILRRLATCAHVWASHMSTRWITGEQDGDQAMVNVFNDERVCDELLGLLDGRVLVNACARDDELQSAGLALFRRLDITCGTRAMDYQAGMMEGASVSNFGVMPVSSSRFAHLHTLGLFHRLDNVTMHGVLCGSGNSRMLAVPNDASLSHLVLAIGSLCIQGSEGHLGPLRLLKKGDVVRFTRNDTYAETSPTPVMSDVFIAHYVRIDAHAPEVTLTRDTRTAQRPMMQGMVSSIDNLNAVAYDVKRRRRDELRAMFPQLAKRVGADQNGHDDEDVHAVVQACLREAQGRRSATEWKLQGIDCGKNLSSRGMSIMLALLLGGWVGARVRVFVGTVTKSSLLGLWNNAKRDFELFDGLCTMKNTFELAPSLNAYIPMQHACIVKQGFILEVLRVKHWKTAIVLEVNKSMQGSVVTVQYMGDYSKNRLDLTVSQWRPLTVDLSDASAILKSLWKGKVRSMTQAALENKKRALESDDAE